eukprot:CAMPEP_0117063612 /NCGR_PEP_ID=MMETSP0472-20121206/44407_1 /TAXON_ID=693140 ORGANISM="Tiarina fusus, Strain LIS" /NCGR_SAMPLE_ID=MMETSP0472 /ASSEMBLY_ACC=CAM_ASM_000603 /LENGTH=56 /DNA_ID=CAMNT_0004783385 /DNA_START=42 /DNA_END=208 /DNA_ORIENTATION=-
MSDANANAPSAEKQRLTHRFVGLIRRNPIKSVALVASVAATVAAKHKEQKREEEFA